MQNKLDQLKTILAEVSDLHHSVAVLGWDQQTYMPPGGAEERGYQLGTLQKLAHIEFTSDEVGKLLDELEPLAEQLEPDSDEARLIKVTRREFNKAIKVPPEWVVEFAQVTTMAHQIWQEAREENNFPKFQPYLEKIVDLRIKYANFFAPYDHIYDPLLDEFEPGLTTKEVREIFKNLRPKQVDLLKAISEKPQVNDSFLRTCYDESKQWEFGVEVITEFGYEWNRGRQDKSAHPFTTTFGMDDVRITTRFNPENASPALFGTLHEAGHGLYELGIAKNLARTPLAEGTSLALHESQSRMWENLVGRSMPFWEHFYPRFQELFPAEVGNVDLPTFYKGINKVEPSLIRVEADEATYNLHIMLRLELEIDLMEGSLQVKDLPEVWNMQMVDYLGIEPPNDTDGVLQDVHWSGGTIGYFSTYALGNLVACQLWECINSDIPTLPDQIRKGEFSELLGWLREKIHHSGSKFEPQELVQKVTGSKINAEPYLEYLEKKYRGIYTL